MDRWPRIYTAGEGDGCVDTEIDMGRHLASDRQQTMTSKERRGWSAVALAGGRGRLSGWPAGLRKRHQKELERTNGLAPLGSN